MVAKCFEVRPKLIVPATDIVKVQRFDKQSSTKKNVYKIKQLSGKLVIVIVSQSENPDFNIVDDLTVNKKNSPYFTMYNR